MRPSDQVDRIRFLFTMLSQPAFRLLSETRNRVMDAKCCWSAGIRSGLAKADGIEPTTSCAVATRSPKQALWHPASRKSPLLVEWWAWEDSNLRPHALSSARSNQPTELACPNRQRHPGAWAREGSSIRKKSHDDSAAVPREDRPDWPCGP